MIHTFRISYKIDKIFNPPLSFPFLYDFYIIKFTWIVSYQFIFEEAKIEKEHKQEKIKIEEKWKSYTKTKLEFNRRYKLAPLEEAKNKLRVQKENLEMANKKCNEKIKQLNQKLKDYKTKVFRVKLQ